MKKDMNKIALALFQELLKFSLDYFPTTAASMKLLHLRSWKSGMPSFVEIVQEGAEINSKLQDLSACYHICQMAVILIMWSILQVCLKAHVSSFKKITLLVESEFKIRVKMSVKAEVPF